MNNTELARYIAEQAFAGKKDLAGESYFDHVARVADQFKTPYMIQAAYLHDLLEDCPEWKEEHLRQLFNENTVNLVLLLTRRKDEDYFGYIRKVMTDYDAVQIKRADLEDNMNVLRFKNMISLSDKDLQRLKKYHQAYHILTR